mgnify:CR=1 FL=1
MRPVEARPTFRARPREKEGRVGLLPGDDPAEGTREVREAIGDMAPYEVTVEQGNHMWPALGDPDIRGVRILTQSPAAVHAGQPGP